MLDLENKKLQFDLKSQQDIDQSLREQLALQEALIQQLQNDQAGQIEQLQSEQATTIQQLQSEQADKIRQLQIDQTNQQSFGDQQLQDKLNQYQGQIDQLKQELQASIAQKQEVKDDLYSQFKQKISSVKRKNELKMEALKEKCDQAIRIVQVKKCL
jgi:hypothetical protein